MKTLDLRMDDKIIGLLSPLWLVWIVYGILLILIPILGQFKSITITTMYNYGNLLKYVSFCSDVLYCNVRFVFGIYFKHSMGDFPSTKGVLVQ